MATPLVQAGQVVHQVPIIAAIVHATITVKVRHIVRTFLLAQNTTAPITNKDSCLESQWMKQQVSPVLHRL